MNLEWLKLANFGEYKHPKGIQLLNESSAKSIVDSFLSIRGRFIRRFQGLPIFIGHPDDPEFSTKNSQIFGRIENIKTEDGALWILIKWTSIGHELFKSGILKCLSPRWLTTLTKDGKLLPKRLLSVGLTNHPNIPCDHISKDDITSQTTSCCDGIATETIETMAIPLSTNQAAETESENDSQQSSAAQGNICSGEGLSAYGIPLHTVSQTSDIGGQTFGKSRCEKILQLVFERMQKFSEKYGDAWLAVKRSNPALFTDF